MDISKFGYISDDEAVNPHMYNWNTVYVPYCDGGVFGGSNSSKTIVDGTEIYFRGANIVNAVIEDLLENKNLKNATDLIITGDSAGGEAAFLHCDNYAEKV